MKFFSVLSIAPIFAALVSAAPATPANATVSLAGAATQNAGLSITNPIQNTSAVMGSVFNIQWTQTDPTASKIQSIALMAGDSAALTTIIANVLDAQLIDISTANYNWTIPTNLTARQDYALAIKGDNTFTTYSSYFSILSTDSGSSDEGESDAEDNEGEAGDDATEDATEDAAEDAAEETGENATEEIDENATEDVSEEAADASVEATEEAADESNEDASKSS
ncbi:hypothetical protein BD560DRAFT_389425 [Blakeslea trispora]|nr:hypothetical protein BD560DRAFT_389425 [Blakeslea trispora]